MSRSVTAKPPSRCPTACTASTAVASSSTLASEAARRRLPSHISRVARVRVGMVTRPQQEREDQAANETADVREECYAPAGNTDIEERLQCVQGDPVADENVGRQRHEEEGHDEGQHARAREIEDVRRQDARDGAASAEHGQGRRRVDEDLQQAAGDAGGEIDDHELDLAQAILDVVAEDPEEQHVAAHVQQVGVQEHRGDQCAEMPAGGDLGGDDGVLRDGVLIHDRVLRQVEIDREIDQDEAPGQERRPAGRVVVPERNHEASARGMSLASCMRRRRAGSSLAASGGSGRLGSPWSYPNRRKPALSPGTPRPPLNASPRGAMVRCSWRAWSSRCSSQALRMAAEVPGARLASAAIAPSAPASSASTSFSPAPASSTKSGPSCVRKPGSRSMSPDESLSPAMLACPASLTIHSAPRSYPM